MIYECIENADYEYVDLDFTDGDPLRLWVLSYDRQERTFSAVLRTAKTVDDLLDDTRDATPEELTQLIAAIPADIRATLCR